MLKPAATADGAEPSRSAGTAHFDGFFAPRSVAIVGASAGKGKPGNVVIENILANGYAGQLYLVNPKGGEILGLPVYPSPSDLPEGIDLAVIIVPAKDTSGGAPRGGGAGDQARGPLRRRVRRDRRGRRPDPARADRHDQRARHPRARPEHLRPHLHAPLASRPRFFPLGKIRRGNVAYIAQTGNFATFTMKYILTGEHFGVSRVVGLGNKIDIDESQALEYLGGDS